MVLKTIVPANKAFCSEPVVNTSTTNDIFKILNKVIVFDNIICLVVLVYFTFSSFDKPLFSLYSTSCLFNPSIISS